MRKKVIFQSLLIIEIIVFGGYYCGGSYGLPTMYRMKTENEKLTQTIDQLKQALKNLEQEKEDFLRYPFYRERIAREQLQMMKPGEELYLYEKNK